MPHRPRPTADCRVLLHQTASAGRQMTRLVPSTEPQEGRAPNSHADSRLFSPSPRPLRNRPFNAHGPFLSSAWLLPVSVRVSDRTSDRHNGFPRLKPILQALCWELSQEHRQSVVASLASLICSLVLSEKSSHHHCALPLTINPKVCFVRRKQFIALIKSLKPKT